MAPPKKYTKEQIIDAAFEIARTEGVDAVTIRKVAEKLGAPSPPSMSISKRLASWWRRCTREPWR